jgi:hypothetical protein
VDGNATFKQHLFCYLDCRQHQRDHKIPVFVRGLLHRLAQMIALDDFTLRALREHHADRHRHEPVKMTQLVQVDAKVIKPPPEAQTTLRQRGLNVGALAVHPGDRRNLPDRAIDHPNRRRKCRVRLNENEEPGYLV